MSPSGMIKVAVNILNAVVVDIFFRPSALGRSDRCPEGDEMDLMRLATCTCGVDRIRF
jgi:hypothetical protein